MTEPQCYSWWYAFIPHDIMDPTRQRSWNVAYAASFTISQSAHKGLEGKKEGSEGGREGRKKGRKKWEREYLPQSFKYSSHCPLNSCSLVNCETHPHFDFYYLIHCDKSDSHIILRHRYWGISIEPLSQKEAKSCDTSGGSPTVWGMDGEDTAHSAGTWPQSANICWVTILAQQWARYYGESG